MPGRRRPGRSPAPRSPRRHGAPWRRRLLSIAALTGVGALAAVLVAYRPSLDPLALHPRAVEFAVAKAELLVDTPVSQLADRNEDIYQQLDPHLAVTDALFLKSDVARQAAADAAGIPGQEISASGPFTLLLGRANVQSSGPAVPSSLHINNNYRLVVEVDGARPMITLFGQAPTERAAAAIVERMRELLIHRVAQQEAAVRLPAVLRAVIRPLGPTTGGVVDPGARTELMGFAFGLVLVLGGGLLVALERRRTRSAAGLLATLDPIADEPPDSDDWPHTGRLLPWAMAAFLAMIFLVPIDAFSLPIHLPLSSNPDRVLLVAIALLWFSALLIVSGAARPRIRISRVHVAVFAFLAVCLLGAGLNLHELAVNQEVVPVLKKLLLLTSFVIFFVIAASVIRPREVPRFIGLMIGLGVIVAIAAIVESKTRYNVFYSLWGTVASVTPPAELDQLDSIGRLSVVGPTSAALELAALLAMVMPFAVVGAIYATKRHRRLLCALASTILVAGAMATLRKTAIVAPAIGLLVLIAYRPRVMIRSLLVASLPLLISVHFISPGKIGSVFSELLPGHASTVLTTTDRVARYDGVRPDVMSHLLLGRGFQSYDPHKYRILDNEYLGVLIGVGAIGLVLYLGIFTGILSLAHPTIRGPDPRRAAAALAAQAAIVIAIVSNTLFDVLSFPHVSYLIFFVAAMILALRETSPIRSGRPAAIDSGERQVQQALVARAPRVRVDELEPLAF